MHILLTDLLTCPRCGPNFGLVVLADRMIERQVVEGSLGCANCRRVYPISSGVAHMTVGEADRMTLQPPPAPPPASVRPGADGDLAIRTAALIGAAPPGGTVLLLEETGRLAPEVSTLLPETHIVGASHGAGDDDPAEGALSRLVCGDRLPFRGASFRACAILGAPGEALLSEVVRTLAPAGRLVLDSGSHGLPRSLVTAGFGILLEQDGVVVAAAPGGR